jgi:hypothetical protein
VRRREILHLLAGVCLGCSRSEPPSTPPARRTARQLTTRDEGRERLAELTRRYEILMRDHGEHEWSRYAGKLEEGPLAQQRMERLRAAEREVFAEAEAVLRRFGDGLIAPRQQALWQQGALGLKLLGDPRSAELSDLLEATINGHAFELDGKPVSRGDLVLMRRSDDARVRRRVRELEHVLHRKAAPIARELFVRRKALAQELSIGSYYQALLELRGIKVARLMGLLGELGELTRPAYRRLHDDFRKQLRTRLLMPWDLEYAAHRMGNPPEQRFVREQALPMAKRLYAAFGIDLDQPKLDITIKDFAFGGQAISVRVPDDVRLVITPTPGARFYGTLLHELGHAYAATRTKAEHALYAGYEWIPGLADPGFAEGLAEVFGRLLDEPRVLRDFVGLTDEEAVRFVASRRLDGLLRVPRALSGITFERVALDSPDADLDYISLELERRTVGAYVPRNTEPVWATSPFFSTYPVYTQSYQLAAMMAVQVRDALKERFGERWISPESGRHLTASCVADGARWTLDEKLVKTTGSPLRVESLVRFLNGWPRS